MVHAALDMPWWNAEQAQLAPVGMAQPMRRRFTSVGLETNALACSRKGFLHGMHLKRLAEVRSCRSVDDVEVGVRSSDGRWNRLATFEQFAMQAPELPSPSRMRPVNLRNHQASIVVSHPFPAGMQGITAAWAQRARDEAEAPSQVLPPVFDRGCFEAADEAAPDRVSKHNERQLRCDIVRKQRRAQASGKHVIDKMVQGFRQPHSAKGEFNPEHASGNAGLSCDQVADFVQWKAPGIGFAPCWSCSCADRPNSSWRLPTTKVGKMRK